MWTRLSGSSAPGHMARQGAQLQRTGWACSLVCDQDLALDKATCCVGAVTACNQSWQVCHRFQDLSVFAFRIICTNDHCSPSEPACKLPQPCMSPQAPCCTCCLAAGRAFSTPSPSTTTLGQRRCHLTGGADLCSLRTSMTSPSWQMRCIRYEGQYGWPVHQEFIG